MQIKDVETQTGMDRSTIRFYEKAGLLHPDRRDNGYREYTKDDLASLYKIKLLRSVGFTVEEVQEIFTEKRSIQALLTERIALLEKEENALAYAKEVCQVMKKEVSSFQELEGEKYLSLLAEKERDTGKIYYKEKKTRSMTHEYTGRRFFARGIDLATYGFAGLLLRVFLFGHIILNDGLLENLFDLVFAVALMQFLEPLLLSKVGTTLGKWLMGLTLRTYQGEKLSYEEGFSRTYEVLKSGLGFLMPVISLYFMYRSYQKVRDGGELSWEEKFDFSYLPKEDPQKWKSLRFNLVLASVLVFSGSHTLVQLYQTLPPHRGDLTLREFSENVRYYQKYLDWEDPDFIFTKEGQWKKVERPHVYTVELTHRQVPMLKYFMEDGKVKEVAFDIYVRDVLEPVGTYGNEVILTYLAMLGAREELNIFSLKPQNLLFALSPLAYDSRAFSKYQVEAYSQLDVKGYEERFGGGIFFPQPEAKEHYFHYTYQVKTP